MYKTRVDFTNQGCKTNEITNDKEETVSTSLSSTINKSSRSPSPSQYSNRSYLIQQQHQQKKNSDLKALPSMQILPPPPPTPSNTRSHLPSVIPPPPPPVNSNPSINGAKQLNKLKRFLTTLQQFASDISPEINERVKNLILNLINSAITIEDFHSRLQETTNFPLRPFVIPFLKTNLPLLQRELVYFSRVSTTTSTAANIYEYLIQSTGSTNDFANDNEDDLNDEIKFNFKRNSNHQTNNSINTNNNTSVNLNGNKRKSPPQQQTEEHTSTNQKQDMHLAPPLSKRHHHNHQQQHHSHSITNPAAFSSNYLLPPPPPLPSPIILKSTQHTTSQQPIVTPSNFTLNNTTTSSNSVNHSQSQPQQSTAFNQSNPNQSMSTTSATSQSIQQLVAPSPINPGFNHHFHGYYPPATQSQQMASNLPSSLNYLNHSAATAAAFSQIKMEDFNKWRDLRERSFTNYMRDFEQSELSDENVEDELKVIDNMSNILNEMTHRSKRVIGLLHKKSSKYRKQLDDYEIEFKRRNDEFKTDRRTEERIEEIKKRADEAVNEVKRQALIEMQKANEMVLREREKFEMLLKETQLIEKQSDNLLESCWNCGRKASETCGGCRQAKYCSQFCQHKNWEWIHHKQCMASKNYIKKNDSCSSINAATSTQVVTTTTANTTSSTPNNDKKESLNLSIEIKQDLNENLNTSSLSENEKKNNKSPKSFTSSTSSSSSPNSNRNQNDDE